MPLKLFSKVYYNKSKEHLMVIANETFKEPIDLIEYYMNKSIRSTRKINFGYFAGLCGCSLGVSIYNNININDIKVFNVSYDVIKNFYRECFSFLLDRGYRHSYSRIQTNFDFLVIQSKKSISEYISFLRFFPYFNYFMMKNRKDYTTGDQNKIKAKGVDISSLSDFKYSLIDILNYNERIEFYLVNVANILTGNLNIFDYFIKYTGENNNRQTIIRQQITFEDILDEEIYKQRLTYDETLYHYPPEIERVKVFRWYLKKFLLKELEHELDEEIRNEDSDELKNNKTSYNILKEHINELENIFHIENEDDYYFFVKDRIEYFINIIRLVYLIRNRDDIGLLLTLLFSYRETKIIVNTDKTKDNFMFNKIKYFDEEKNINLYIS